MSGFLKAGVQPCRLGALENYWTITQAEADRLLVSNLSDAEAVVNRLHWSGEPTPRSGVLADTFQLPRMF